MNRGWHVATRALVVALPDDPITVHLVAEVAWPEQPVSTPGYRALMTVCGQVGYQQTERTRSACPECERGINEALDAARRAFLAMRER